MQITKRNCPLCQSVNKQLALEMEAQSFCEPNFAYVEDPYELLGITRTTKFYFARCRDCGFMFSDDLLDDASLTIVYDKIINPAICKEYSLSEKVFEENRDNLNQALASFADSGRIRKALDFGAGWGTWAMVASQRIGDVYCYETSPVRRKHILESGLNLIDSESELMSRPGFDLINFNQVLEHLPNPRETLEKLNRLLSHDGAIWLTVPNCQPDYFERQAVLIAKGQNPKELNPWEHLNYFTPDTLLEMCQRAGLVPHGSFSDPQGRLPSTRALFVKNAHASSRAPDISLPEASTGRRKPSTWAKRLRRALRI